MNQVCRFHKKCDLLGICVSVISAVAEAGQKGDDLTKMFFKEEYALNYAIGKL